MSIGQVFLLGPLSVNEHDPDVSGNILLVSVSSADKLTVPRKINGIPFDGSQDIVVSDSSAGKIVINNDNTSNSTAYVPFLFTTSGTATSMSVANAKLLFKPSTGELTANAFNTTSDERKKINIVPMEYGIDTVMKMKPKKFNFINSDQESIGFIAQDLWGVVPEVVAMDDSGYLSVNYAILNSVLVNAIKDLKSEIDMLKKYIMEKDRN